MENISEKSAQSCKKENNDGNVVASASGVGAAVGRPLGIASTCVVGPALFSAVANLVGKVGKGD